MLKIGRADLPLQMGEAIVEMPKGFKSIGVQLLPVDPTKRVLSAQTLKQIQLGAQLTEPVLFFVYDEDAEKEPVKCLCVGQNMHLDGCDPGELDHVYSLNQPISPTQLLILHYFFTKNLAASVKTAPQHDTGNTTPGGNDQPA